MKMIILQKKDDGNDKMVNGQERVREGGREWGKTTLENQNSQRRQGPEGGRTMIGEIKQSGKEHVPCYPGVFSIPSEEGPQAELS
jgi:hypothetical protein